jgi:hypothetical protein
MMEAAGRFHREVTRGKRCARCGRTRLLEAHHVVPKQTLKQEIDNERHVDVLYDPRNGLALCAICHERHTNASDRVPRSLVPAAAWGFAAEHGFETGEVKGGESLENHTNSAPATTAETGRMRKQLTLDVGGFEPTVSLVKFSGAIGIEGEFEKGDHVRFEVTGRIGTITHRDIEDAHGYVVATERVHGVKLRSGGPSV